MNLTLLNVSKNNTISWTLNTGDFLLNIFASPHLELLRCNDYIFQTCKNTQSTINTGTILINQVYWKLSKKVLKLSNTITMEHNNLTRKKQRHICYSCTCTVNTGNWADHSHHWHIKLVRRVNLFLTTQFLYSWSDGWQTDSKIILHL